jgi:hypothetical protein
MLNKWLVVGMALLPLCSCHDRNHLQAQATINEEGRAMAQEVTIKLGELGPDFAKRYGSMVRVTHPTPNTDSYKIRWDEPRGVVRLEHGRNSLTIEDTLSVSSMQSLSTLKDEGLFEFNVNAGVTSPDLIPHDEARLKTHAILRDIMNAGWKQVIERSEPRLKGKARQDYMFATSNLNGLDAAYTPTFEEWMRVESRTPWSFYANGVYLEVTFTREPTLTDPAKPGSYLLSFNIKTETEYFRGYAGPDNRLRWKEVVPQELVKVAALRASKEAELRAKGVAIDESYQDPPVPVMK